VLSSPDHRSNFQDTLGILEYFVLYEVSILNRMVSWLRRSNALLRRRIDFCFFWGVGILMAGKKGHETYVIAVAIIRSIVCSIQYHVSIIHHRELKPNERIKTTS
jgi:hypothetical protein